jgi:hypothetical protein
MQSREVAHLVCQGHLRVEPALLGHVAEPQAVGLADRVTLPAHRPVIRLKDSHHCTHGCRLAGPVATDQADDLALTDSERHLVERYELTKAVSQA